MFVVWPYDRIKCVGRSVLIHCELELHFILFICRKTTITSHVLIGQVTFVDWQIHHQWLTGLIILQMDWFIIGWHFLWAENRKYGFVYLKLFGDMRLVRAMRRRVHQLQSCNKPLLSCYIVCILALISVFHIPNIHQWEDSLQITCLPRSLENYCMRLEWMILRRLNQYQPPNKRKIQNAMDGHLLFFSMPDADGPSNDMMISY